MENGRIIFHLYHYWMSSLQKTVELEKWDKANLMVGTILGSLQTLTRILLGGIGDQFIPVADPTLYPNVYEKLMLLHNAIFELSEGFDKQKKEESLERIKSSCIPKLVEINEVLQDYLFGKNIRMSPL